MPAKLIIIEGHDKGRNVSLLKKTFNIGRSSDNDLVLSDDLTSRNHAELVCLPDGKFMVRDRRSKNGIFVNGEKVIERVVRDSDIIKIGHNKLLFKAEGSGPSVDVENLSAHAQEADYKADPGSRPIPTADEDDPTNIAFKNSISGHDPSTENLRMKTKAICQLASTLKSVDDEAVYLKSVVNILLQVIYLDRLAIFSCDPSMKSFNSRLSYSRQGDPLELDDTAAGKIREHLSSGDASCIIGRSGDMENISMIACRLTDEDRISGILALESDSAKYTYAQGDIEFLEAVSDHISVGLTRAGLVSKNKALDKRVETLERQLSPEIASAVADRTGALFENPFDAKEREVTVLFSDIESFTTLSEKLSPSELATLLNQYFSRMVEAVIANNGTINKFIGDAVMALFGAPLKHGNDPANAVSAALSMIGKLKELHSQIDPKKRFNIRIGINTGNAVAGLIGSEKRMEYTVLGDTVNCASRIEGLAPTNGVAVGETTYQKVKGSFKCEHLGKLNVKGKTQPINVYLVTGLL